MRAKAGQAVCPGGKAPDRLRGEVRKAILRERDRMARDVHDTVAQSFTGIIIQLEAAEDSLQRGDLNEAGVHLRRVGKLAREGLAEAGRSVQALRPQVLQDQSLRAALEQIIRRMTPGSGLRASLRCTGQPRPLAAHVAEGLLRIGQEALTNTLKHAHADRFQAQLDFSPGEVRLEVTDNGCGFEAGTTIGGFGLLGMKERVARLGGRLEIESSPGHGCCIVVAVPATAGR